MKAMITGHRPGNKLDESAALGAMTGLLSEWADDEEYITVISGGADGVDRLWARSAFNLGVEYELFVPWGYFEHYHEGKSWVSEIKRYAVDITYTQGSEIPFHWKYNHDRNIQMIEAADTHVACTYKPIRKMLGESKGGTAHCVKAMVDRGIYPIRIDSLTGTITRNTEGDVLF